MMSWLTNFRNHLWHKFFPWISLNRPSWFHFCSQKTLTIHENVNLRMTTFLYIVSVGAMKGAWFLIAEFGTCMVDLVGFKDFKKFLPQMVSKIWQSWRRKFFLNFIKMQKAIHHLKALGALSSTMQVLC